MKEAIPQVRVTDLGRPEIDRAQRLAQAPEELSGVGSCNINTVSDTTKCKPCTQVPSCLDTCDTCGAAPFTRGAAA